MFWIIFGLLGGIPGTQSAAPPLDNTTLSSLESPRPRYRVVTIQSKPWVMKIGDNYSGLIIDILDEISNRSRFDYEIYESPDNRYGTLDYQTGQFNGVVGQVEAARADIGAADLTVTDARSQVVTFSSPFFETGAQILLLKPEKTQLSFLILLSPFTADAWGLLLASFVVMGNLKQTTPTSAKALSTVWWCFLLAFLALYTSNLTCCLSASRSNDGKLPFTTFHDMVGQSDISYGGWLGMRLNLNDGLQRRMDRFITSRYTHFTSIEEAVTRIRSTHGRFAAIVDGHHGKTMVNKNCDLILLREQLFSIYNSFACQKSEEGESICSTISQALSTIRDEGTLFSLFKFWMDKESESNCSPVSEDDFESRNGQPEVSFEPLSLGETAPLFVLVLVGVLVTVVILVGEIRWNKKGRLAAEMEEASPLQARQCQNKNSHENPSRTSSNMSTTVVSDEKTS